MAILGIVGLNASRQIILLQQAALQATLYGNNVHRVAKVTFLPIKLDNLLVAERALDDDHAYLKLLKYHLSQANLLYSQTLDLSNNLQSSYSSGIDDDDDDSNNDKDKTTALANLTSLRPLPINLYLLKNFNSKFFWNQYLLSELLQLLPRSPQVADFVVPLIYGYASFNKLQSAENGINGQKHQQVYMGIISRRSKFRAGTRYFRRGIDNNGNVANFNETEQIVVATSSNPAVYSNDNNTKNKIAHNLVNVLSFLQIRGSIPLHWAEINNLQYKPQLAVSRNLNVNSSYLHFKSLFNDYECDKVYVVNLVNSKGHELPIKSAFESTIDQLIDNDFESGSSNNVRKGRENWKNGIATEKLVSSAKINYIYFDFHDHCKKLNFSNVKLLLTQLQQRQFSNNDYFQIQFESSNPAPSNFDVISVQRNIIRSNCMDCLDRTNVVQSVIGKWMLKQQLANIDFHYTDEKLTAIDYDKLEKNDLSTTAITATPSSNVLTNPHSFTRIFNEVWTLNGNYISKAYSGTSALKADFTRTGKRTINGAVKDLINSLLRYAKNNFTDGYRQDAYDLFLGNFQPSLYNNSIDVARYEKYVAVAGEGSNTDNANGHGNLSASFDPSAFSNGNSNNNGHTINTSTSTTNAKNHLSNRASIHHQANANANLYNQFTPYAHLQQLTSGTGAGTTTSAATASILYPSNVNLSSSPFLDSRTFKYQSLPYLLFLTLALFMSVLFFPRGQTIFTRNNLILLGTCFAVLNYSLYFLVSHGVQFVNWPKLCDLGYLKKRKIVSYSGSSGAGDYVHGYGDQADLEVEGFEYVVAEDYDSFGVEKLD